jgi:glycosyltransferase involved in cell wall biosynthesis
MRRITDEATLEALRALTEGASRWSKESAPSLAARVTGRGAEEKAAPRNTALAPEAPAPCVAHFTRSLWAERSAAQAVALLRGLAPGQRHHLAVLEDGGPLRGSVLRCGVEPVSFREPARVRARRPSPRIDAVVEWLRTSPAELVHVHDVSSALIAIPAALRVGRGVVLDRSEPLSARDRTQRAALRWLTRHVRHVVVDAEATRQRLVREEGLPAEHLTVIRPGFDLEGFDAAARAGLQRPVPDTRGAPVVVHVAPMDGAARCEEDLLSALALARRRVPGLRAFLVGDGPRRAALEQRAGALGLSDGVHFLGWRPDVPAVLALGTVGVRCPSEEGLSRSVMEGMAARLPMVVTDVGGNAELIPHGERGLLVPVGSPEALAEALVRTLDDLPGARRLAANARAFVARELSLPRMVASYEALYRRVALPS